MLSILSLAAFLFASPTIPAMIAVQAVVPVPIPAGQLLAVAGAFGMGG